MNPSLDRLHSLPDAEAWTLYRAWVAADLATPDTHLHGSRIARHLGHLHSAHTAIQAGLACHPEGELKGRIRFEYGVVSREIGLIDQAVDQLRRWMQDLDNEYPSLADTYLGAAHYNRGLALRQASRYAESISDYERACREFRKFNKAIWLCMALQNLAWAATLAGQHQLAAAALEEARPLSTTPDLTWHQKIGEAFLDATSPTGDVQRAMTLCREIIDCTDPDLPRIVRTHAYWVSARVAWALNLLEDAKALVEQSLLWAALAGDENHCLAEPSDLWRELSVHEESSPAG